MESNAVKQKGTKETKEPMPVQAAKALHELKVSNLEAVCVGFKDYRRGRGFDQALKLLLEALDEERHAAEYLERVKQPQLTEEDLRRIERGLQP